MAEQDTNGPATVETDDAILFETEEGISEALTPEQLALRERVGTGPEGAEVTPSQLAALRRAQVTDQVYGGLGQQAITAAEGFASGLTFGLTDVLQTEEGAYNAALRAQANPFTRSASTVLGAVAPSILTGGSGAAASLARLTPAGRVAALTGSIAARGGSSLTGRVAAGAAAGFVDGAAAGVGNYLAQISLDEDADFSAESLLAAAGKGGLTGAALGGALPAVGRLSESVAARVSGRADDQALGRLGEDVLEAGAKRAGRGARAARAKAAGKADELIRDTEGALRTARREYISFKAVAPRGFGDDAQRALGRLAKSIDDKALASVDTALDDALTIAAARGTDDATQAALKIRAKSAGDSYKAASAEAREWIETYTRTSKNATEEVADALSERGAISMARLDDAKALLDETLAAVRGDAATAATATAPGRFRRLADTAQNVAGALEVAQDLGAPLGLPSVRSIPVIGDAMSAYLKLKAGLRVARQSGLVPSTGPSRAAATVNRTRDQISAKVSAAARGAYANVAPAARIAPAQIAAQIAALAGVETTDQAVGATQDAGLRVTEAATRSADRQVEYLRATAPKNPMAGSPWGANWTPTPSQAEDWSRRYAAVTEPAATIDRLLFGDPMNALEAEALRNAWPALYFAARQDVMAHATELVQRDPVRAAAIGRAFDVPLSITQLPGYGAPVEATPGPTASPSFGGPSAATASPLVTGELTTGQARAAHRR